MPLCQRRTCRTLAATLTFLTLLGTAACSDDSDQAAPHEKLAAHLCDTGISTAPVKELFPGPYKEAYQSFSRHHSMTSLKKGWKEGDCTVNLVFGESHPGEHRINVNIHAFVSNDETAKESVSQPSHMQLVADYSVRVGEMSGVTGRNGAAIAFPCRERTDQAKSVSVEIHFDPRQEDATGKRKRQLSKTSGTYVVRAARYLNEHYLKCLSPKDLSGPVDLRKAGGRQ